MTDVTSPLQGTIVRVEVEEGDLVRAGQQAVVIESMKMEHVVVPEVSGIVRRVVVAVGDTVLPGQALLVVEETDVVATDEGHQQVYRDGAVRGLFAHFVDTRAQLPRCRDAEGSQSARFGDRGRQRCTGQSAAHSRLSYRNVEPQPVRDVHA